MPSLQPVVAGLSGADYDQVIDVTPYMNAYPYTLDRDASLSRVFRLFRTMGLRHIVVGACTDLDHTTDFIRRRRHRHTDIHRHRHTHTTLM